MQMMLTSRMHIEHVAKEGRIEAGLMTRRSMMMTWAFLLRMSCVSSSMRTYLQWRQVEWLMLNDVSRIWSQRSMVFTSAHLILSSTTLRSEKNRVRTCARVIRESGSYVRGMAFRNMCEGLAVVWHEAWSSPVSTWRWLNDHASSWCQSDVQKCMALCRNNVSRVSRYTSNMRICLSVTQRTREVLWGYIVFLFMAMFLSQGVAC